MHSAGASLAIWLSAGLLAWTGASSFAELGASLPVNGGAQAYLAYAYGPLVAHLFAWTAIIVLSPGASPSPYPLTTTTDDGCVRQLEGSGSSARTS